ncbi:MAG: M28 family peptidase [Solirubrobacteraceae bacterium]
MRRPDGGKGTLEDDVAALAAMERGSASEGERRSAAWIAGRLGEVGIESDVEPYRGRRTFAWAYALLAVSGLLAARLRRRFGWPLSLAAIAALELDASGRLSLPVATGEGANVVARIPATGRRVRTVVLVAHHDTQRAGAVWNPALHEPGAARRLASRSIPPYLPPAAAALVLHRTRLGRGLLWLLAATSVEQALRPPVPGANDNASGVAAALALLEGFAATPLEDTEVIGAFVGSEESGMHGMRAFLRSCSLDPSTTLVICLDTLGCGKPIALRAEHALLRYRYAERDLALVPADVERWSIGGWTDALQAKLAGLRTVSLLSIGPKGLFTHYHHPSDTPEHVDFASVRACLEVAEETITAFVAGG